MCAKAVLNVSKSSLAEHLFYRREDEVHNKLEAPVIPASISHPEYEDCNYVAQMTLEMSHVLTYYTLRHFLDNR